MRWFVTGTERQRSSPDGRSGRSVQLPGGGRVAATLSGQPIRSGVESGERRAHADQAQICRGAGEGLCTGWACHHRDVVPQVDSPPHA